MFHAHDVFLGNNDVARDSPAALSVPHGTRGRPRHIFDRADGAKTYVKPLH